MRSLLLGPYSLQTARRATAVALFFQWFIVVTGATVRLTGSGLGCPNWPTCTTTRPVPELSLHPMVEFLNRMTATPTLLAAAIALWVCWRLARPVGARPRRDLRIASSLVVLGILGQAVVGAFTVILELPPEVVAVHFLLSVLLLVAATVAHHAAGSPTRIRVARHAPLRLLAAGVMLLSLLAVIVAGVLTTASGPHSGASGTGQHVDRFGIFNTAVTFHARGAYAFLVLALLLTWLRSRDHRALRGTVLRDLGLLAALVVVQIALGEIQYRNGLPWQVVLAHVANAALLWAVAARIAADAVFPVAATSPAPVSPRAPVRAYDAVS
ncbi:MAG: COX15/CtaA family protein [Thermoleophilia bacterium]|nr:COX15/CtaA family protein [Thermoleophilia bacterium]